MLSGPTARVSFPKLSHVIYLNEILSLLRSLLYQEIISQLFIMAIILYSDEVIKLSHHYRITWQINQTRDLRGIMSTPKSPDPSAFWTRKSSSSILFSMPGCKLQSTCRKRCVARHSKCRRSNSADFLGFKCTIRCSR